MTAPRNILLLGGTGFVGRALCVKLVERNGDEWLDFLAGRQPDTPYDKAIAVGRGVRVRVYPDIRLELFK